MTATVELVSFGIQAAIKLARTGRKIYVEGTANRVLTLPVPAGLKIDLATTAFEHARRLQDSGGAAAMARFRARFEADFAIAKSGSGASGERRRRAESRLVESYLLEVGRGFVGDQGGNPEDLAGLAALDQFGEHLPFPSPLQRVAGTLAEVAIDYFVLVPGAVDRDTKHGRAIASILEGLDTFDFQNTSWDGIVVALFKAGLDALGDHPELITGNDERRVMITRVLGGVSQSLQEHLGRLDELGDLDGFERLKRVGQIAARSLLRNAAAELFERPDIIGINREADQAVFASVGGALVDLLLGDTGEGRAYLFKDAADRLVSGRGLDRLILSFLKATSEHPEFFRVADDELRGFIGEILEDIYAEHAGGKSFLDPDVFFEVASVVFEKGVRDLPLLLHMTEGRRAVAVEVARLVYDMITHLKGGQPEFDLGLARSDVVGLFQSTLGIVTRSEAWLDGIDRATNDATRALGVLRTAMNLLLDEGPDGIRAILAEGRFDVGLEALLDSGLAELLLDRADARKLDLIRAAIRERLPLFGRSGLSLLFEEGRLLDLMAAIARSPAVLEPLVDGPTKKRVQAVDRILGVVLALRRGEILSVMELTALLESAGGAEGGVA